MDEYIRPFLGKFQFVQSGKRPVRGCFKSSPGLSAGAVAEMGDEQTSNLPFIDVTRLPTEEVFKRLSDLLSDKHDLPCISNMVKSFTSGVYHWAKSGFIKTSPEQIEQRLAVCRSCEWWDLQGFRGTGRCRKCGCSTWAKMRMQSATCPIGKWPEIRVEPDDITDNL